jgi:hypothetical protein
MTSMCKSTVGPILYAKSSSISIMNTHTGLVISEVVTSFSITCSSMQQWTTGKKIKYLNKKEDYFKIKW